MASDHASDLQVGRIVLQSYESDGSFHEGHPFVVAAEVHNRGTHGSGPFHVDLDIDNGHSHHQVAIADLAAGATDWAQWQVDSALSGDHVVKAHITGHGSTPAPVEHHFHIGAGAGASSASAESDTDIAELADGFLDAQLGVLRQWHYALQEFDKTMTSETTESAKPDFAAALAKYFAEKIFTAVLPEDAHAELIFGAVKAAFEEAERAKKAAISVRLRDFFNNHLEAIATIDQQLTTVKASGWAHHLPETLAALLAQGQADVYAYLREQIKYLHDVAVHNLGNSSPTACFDALAAEWIDAGVADKRYDAGILVSVSHSDMSVIRWEVEGADAAQLHEHLAGQHGGIDLWNFPVPRIIGVMNDSHEVQFYVHVDEHNRLINSPAEDSGPQFHEFYDRLHQQGHLLAH